MGNKSFIVERHKPQQADPSVLEAAKALVGAEPRNYFSNMVPEVTNVSEVYKSPEQTYKK